MNDRAKPDFDGRPTRSRGRLGKLAAVAVLSLGLGACATGDQEMSGFEQSNDPLELLNRTIFAANQTADLLVIRPVTVTYNQVVPEFMRDSVTNVLRNMRTPVIIVNEILQGDFEGAGRMAERFFINTTVGIGGLFDLANHNNQGWAYEAEDFGQTMGVWGVGEGPYLVLPLLGPSNVRDAIGIGIDSLIDPIGYLTGGNFYFAAGRIAATVVDIRSRTIEQLDEIEASSVDYYASIRSLYRQVRAADILDGDVPEDSIDIPDIETLNFVPSEPEPAAAAPVETGDSVSELVLEIEPLPQWQ